MKMAQRLETAQKMTKKVLMERGYRKYILLLICFAVLSAGLVVSAVFPAVGVNYTTFVGGIIGLYTVYCSGNVAAKFSPTAKEDETASD